MTTLSVAVRIMADRYAAASVSALSTALRYKVGSPEHARALRACVRRSRALDRLLDALARQGRAA